MNNLVDLIKQLLSGDFTTIIPLRDLLQEHGRMAQHTNFNHEVSKLIRKCRDIERRRLYLSIKEEPKEETTPGRLVTLPERVPWYIPHIHDESIMEYDMGNVTNMRGIWQMFKSSIEDIFWVELIGIQEGIRLIEENIGKYVREGESKE